MQRVLQPMGGYDAAVRLLLKKWSNVCGRDVMRLTDDAVPDHYQAVVQTLTAHSKGRISD